MAIDKMLEKLYSLGDARIAETENIHFVLENADVSILTKTLKGKTAAQRIELLDLFTSIMSDQQLFEVCNLINKFQDEIDPRDAGKPPARQKIVRRRIDTLERAKRFATCANKPIGLAGADGRVSYPPYIDSMQVVWIDFTGLGSEVKGRHPAVVWKADAYVDTFTVIPLNSYRPGKHVEKAVSFKIGKIKLFDTHASTRTDVGELDTISVCDVGQMTTVSHKRLFSFTFANTRSNPSTWDYAFINETQKQRIMEGVMHYMFDKQTLYDAEIKPHFDKVPVFLTDPDVQFTHLHRLFKRDDSSMEDRLVYTVEGDPRTYVLERKKANTSPEDVKEAISTWVNSRAHTRESGRVVVRTDEEVQRFQYNMLQALKDEGGAAVGAP